MGFYAHGPSEPRPGPTCLSGLSSSSSVRVDPHLSPLGQSPCHAQTPDTLNLVLYWRNTLLHTRVCVCVHLLLDHVAP